MYFGHNRIGTRIADLNARFYYGPRNMVRCVLAYADESPRSLQSPRSRRWLRAESVRRAWAALSRSERDDG